MSKANCRPPPPNRVSPYATTHGANEDVCGDTRSTHAISSTLHGKPTSQNSRPGASCTVVATRVEWSATPAVKERGRRKLRKSKVRKEGGSMRVRAQIGLVENAAPAPQPPCDFSIAFSLSDMTENNRSRNWRSTLDEASCCHPTRLVVVG